MSSGSINALKPSHQADTEELWRETMGLLGLLLAATTIVPWWLTLPEIDVQWPRFLIFFSFTVEGSVAYFLRARQPRAAQAVLLLGSTLSLAWALSALGSPVLAYFAVLIVVAASAFDPRLGFAAAALNTVSLSARLPLGETLLTALGLLLSVTAIQWISSRSLYTALGWARNSEKRASHLLTQLRDNQGLLNRTLRAMDEANARLALANARLAEARRQADDARQAKARFAANVSHELRTPLNVIVGFVEVMYTTPQAYPGADLSTEFLVDLGAVYRNVQHLQKLIDDVLDLSQLEQGKFVLQPAESNLADVIREAIDTVHRLATVRGLSIDTQIAADLPRVYIDRTRMKQVLLNLLSNAARYTEEGSITVRVTSDGHQVLCSVADTGAGIPQDQQEKLFQEFERLSIGRASPPRGSGLGLAISKRLVQEHGGQIWVESTPGVGSTFTFTLPVFSGEVSLGGAQLQPWPLPMVPQPERDPVLLVSQSLIAARLFARHLRGYRCLSVREPQLAAQQIAALQPRGVIVDAALGSEAVEQLGQAIRERSIPGIPLIVCPLHREAASQTLGSIRGYLTKPVSRQDLLDTMRTLGSEIETVLTVDDDPDMLRLLSQYLQDDVRRPYRVLTAKNGRQALQAMSEARPDLLLLDLVMPVMDGYQLLQEMKRVPRLVDVPVVIFSGRDAIEEQRLSEAWLRMEMPQGMSVDQLVRGIGGLVRAMHGSVPEG